MAPAPLRNTALTGGYIRRAGTPSEGVSARNLTPDWLRCSAAPPPGQWHRRRFMLGNETAFRGSGEGRHPV